MGVCCLHIGQERGSYGEKMSAVDLNEEDTTESFVDLSESDDTVQEKEQLLQESQSEQVQMNSEQGPDPSQDITCDYKTEGSPRNEGLAYREEKPWQEPKEPGKNTGYRETRETSTEDGPESSPEDDYSTPVPYAPGEMLGPQEDAEYDNGMPGGANQKTQTGGDGYGSPQETPSGGSQEEAVEEHNATLANKPEPRVGQDDQGGSMASKRFQEGNLQETSSQKESAAVHTEEAMDDVQVVKEKQELHNNQTDEGIDEESLDRKDASPHDHLEEQMTMHERDQEQTGRTRENMSGCTREEQPVEPLQPKTEGSDWSQSLWTSKVNGVVTLRMENSGPAAMSPVTVPQFFSDMVKKHGQKVALCARMADEWKEVTYAQYEQQSRTMAKAFLKLGLERFHAVLILGSNSPEWFMADIAAMLAGGLAVGIDPLSNASFCLKVALDSQAQMVLVEDHNQLEKILKIKNKLRKLKAIVQWRGAVMEPSPGVYTWNQLLDLGSEVDESTLDDIMADQKPNQCCAVIYSTDEAGEPRGAMISHDNVTWTSRALQEMLGLGSEEVVVSYLPLGSMSVQLFDLWLILSCGGSTFFTEPAAWKRSLVSTLCDVRPTLFLGFPGLWEKVKKRWMLVEKEASALQKMAISWARRKGLQSYTSSGSLPGGHSLAEHMIFRPARVALGLDRCARCYVGTEPISQNVAEYFGSLGLDLLEIYGKEETSGLQSIMLPSGRRPGRVELAGCKSREYTDGLCLWGRNVFLGYLGAEQMTSEAFTEDGWFITGRPRPLKGRNEDPEDLSLEL